MGHRLGASSDRPEQPFTFFLMRDRQINAFATLGGYVGMNAGTVLAARNEDEVAGVLAHEISHVTQRHVLRAVERAQKDRIPLMLATLGVIIAAQQGSRDNNSGYGSSKDDAIQAAVIGAQALAIQRQINYTRTSEAEADRVGIHTLYRSGYSADGMADFFERMQRLSRSDSGDATPSYLQTHPLGTTRLAEARERADRLRREAPASAPRPATGSGNLLLPMGLQPACAGRGRRAGAPVRMGARAPARAHRPQLGKGRARIEEPAGRRGRARHRCPALRPRARPLPQWIPRPPPRTPCWRWPRPIPTTCSSAWRWPTTPRSRATRRWRESATRRCSRSTRTTAP
jgi:hypothetical protein